MAAFSQGRRLVKNAVAAARWSETQRQELRAPVPQLTPEQREDVIRTLLVSINSGKMRVEPVGAPF
ncbi:hypothetical protein [Corallococcus macrosporus]|uniref:hypothetical protein n=1 Tax=Corallococcus macrosporus TaxID=35 RepID=UPI001EFE2E41|nr:hypothetical protein [Corallococcus macrosporus]